MDEYYYVYLARVVGAARDRNHNSFSARGDKNWSKLMLLHDCGTDDKLRRPNVSPAVA